MAGVCVSMIVLRSAVLKRAVEFYRAIGFEFAEFQHEPQQSFWGAYQSSVGLEVRAGGENGSLADKRVAGAAMLEFTVLDLEAVVRALSLTGVKFMSPIQSNGMCRYVITRDPDGRPVRLLENSLEVDPMP